MAALPEAKQFSLQLSVFCYLRKCAKVLYNC